MLRRINVGLSKGMSELGGYGAAKRDPLGVPGRARRVGEGIVHKNQWPRNCMVDV